MNYNFELVRNYSTHSKLWGTRATPYIDVHLNIWFKQLIINNKVVNQFRIHYGSMHDGFPWHELYFNGYSIFRHNPFETGETVSSLVGDGDHLFMDTIFHSGIWYAVDSNYLN